MESSKFEGNYHWNSVEIHFFIEKFNDIVWMRFVNRISNCNLQMEPNIFMILNDKQSIKNDWKNFLYSNNKYWYILHHKAGSRNWYILLEVQFAACLHFLFILRLDLPNTKLFFQRRAFPIVFSPSCKFLPSHPINRGIGSYIII